MSYIKGISRNQTLLFPEVIEDYIEEDNPVRFIDAYVDSLDLVELKFKYAVEAETGRPPYNPTDMLKLYIYGYLNSIRSSRNLEKETYRNIEVVWLLKKLHPDFKTIADFRKDNKKAIKKVCREFILLCKKLELFGAELIAIDGSKLRAVNSKERTYTPNRLKQLIKHLDKKIEDYFRGCDSQDKKESEVKKVDKDQLNAKIKSLLNRREKYQDIFNDLEARGKKQVSLTDEDSRLMHTSQGQQVSYNAQIAVDEKNNLIVAEDVTNDVTDINSLSEIAMEAKETLGVEQIDAVTDMGYYNGSEIKRSIEEGITPYISKPDTSANTKLGLFGKNKFKYNSKRDCYICPAGEELPFRFNAYEKGRHIKYYWNKKCKACSLKPKCTRNKNFRRITRWIDEDILDEMQTRVDANPQMMWKRKCIVEHPFGTLKRTMNQGYFLTKGLSSVKTEFSLSILAYNIKRVMNIIGVRGMIEALV